MQHDSQKRWLLESQMVVSQDHEADIRYWFRNQYGCNIFHPLFLYQNNANIIIDEIRAFCCIVLVWCLDRTSFKSVIAPYLQFYTTLICADIVTSCIHRVGYMYCKTTGTCLPASHRVLCVKLRMHVCVIACLSE